VIPIGHATVRQQLERELPPVALLRGPRSVGKWTLAMHLVEHHRIARVDRFLHDGPLGVLTVRAIIDFVGIAPFGKRKISVLTLDGASEPAFNALLKVLEEPPVTARFVLTAAGPLPATVLSRAQIYQLGLLADAELRQILIAQGVPAGTAVRAGALGRGQVDVALYAARGQTDRYRTTVLTLLRALATHDHELFDRVFTSDWEEPCRELLWRWVTEAVSGQWSLFGPADGCGLHTRREQLHQMVYRLSALPAAHTRLGVRVALEPFLAT